MPAPRTFKIPPGSPSQDRPSGPVRLPSMVDRQDAMRDHLETVHYVNEDGTPYAPPELPTVGDEHDDDDEE